MDDTALTASETPQESPQQATSAISEVLERASKCLAGNNRRMSTIRERLQGAKTPPEEANKAEGENVNGMLSVIHGKALDLCNMLDAQAEIITDLERV